jgi:hypothetical protein
VRTRCPPGCREIAWICHRRNHLPNNESKLHQHFRNCSVVNKSRCKQEREGAPRLGYPSRRKRDRTSEALPEHTAHSARTEASR